MTKQDKELLLKDLCARLPYGVKIKFNDGTNDIYNLDGNIHGRFTESLIQAIEDLELKPYLRPMSSMTEKEIKEWDNICVMMRNMPIESIPMIERFVNSKHLDYNNLILRGFALEAPESMYNS